MTLITNWGSSFVRLLERNCKNESATYAQMLLKLCTSKTILLLVSEILETLIVEIKKIISGVTHHRHSIEINIYLAIFSLLFSYSKFTNI